jgi:hypothetical protein
MECAFYVVYDLYGFPNGLDFVASMRCFYGLDYVFVYACPYDTSMLASVAHLWATHYTWYLVTCNELIIHGRMPLFSQWMRFIAAGCYHPSTVGTVQDGAKQTGLVDSYNQGQNQTAPSETHLAFEKNFRT